MEYSDASGAHATSQPNIGTFKIMQRTNDSHQIKNVTLENWEDFGGDDPVLEALQRARKDEIQLEKQAHKIQQQQISVVTACPNSVLPRTESAPVVRIMRRPNSAKDLNTQDESKDELKTLEQRELEYKEARLRIFGVGESVPVEEDSGLSAEELLLKHKLSGLSLQDQVSQQLTTESTSQESVNVANNKKKKRKKRGVQNANQTSSSPSPASYLDEDIPVNVRPFVPQTRFVARASLSQAPSRPSPMDPNDSVYGRPPVHLMHRVVSCPDTSRPPPLPPGSNHPFPSIAPPFSMRPPQPSTSSVAPPSGAQVPLPATHFVTGQYFPPHFNWK